MEDFRRNESLSFWEEQKIPYVEAECGRATTASGGTVKKWDGGDLWTQDIHHHRLSPLRRDGW